MQINIYRLRTQICPRMRSIYRSVKLRFWQPVAIADIHSKLKNLTICGGCMLADSQIILAKEKTWITAWFLLKVGDISSMW